LPGVWAAAGAATAAARPAAVKPASGWRDVEIWLSSAIETPEIAEAALRNAINVPMQTNIQLSCV